jgi:RNA polymerase sigma factor (sigma-70 family)
VRLLGDFDIAEEIVQDTLVTALERWRADGIPDRPGAWLTTAARRRAIDRLRRDGAYRHKLALLAAEPFAPADPDDRLRLIFTCCHPALSREAQLALTLRAVCGFTTAQIAHAFVVSESAVAQRLARARRKIVIGGIPYRVPDPDELDERLDQVLYPRHAETLGLLALIRLHLARAGSRFTADHDLILLPDQDRGRWDRALIADALALLDRAATLRRPGPYQLQAAIVACHTEATTWQDTDWQQILALYDLLLTHAPSPVVRLNRSVAVLQVAGPTAALGELDGLAAELDGYHLYHAVRGAVLVELGRREQARAAELRALALTANRAEQSLLRRRLGG